MTAASADKHGASAPRLLDEVSACIRAKHYSLRMEQAYLHWIKRFIFFHDKQHPRDRRAAEVEPSFPHLPSRIMFYPPRKIKPWPRCFFSIVKCCPWTCRGWMA